MTPVPEEARRSDEGARHSRRMLIMSAAAQSEREPLNEPEPVLWQPPVM